MIIECVSCNKKFDVNSELIPDGGRTIQCGACGHVWFFDKKDQKSLQITEKIEIKQVDNKTKKVIKREKEKKVGYDDSLPHKKKALVKYQAKTSFTLGKFLSYILVSTISFISFIIILDTFKIPLSNYFPNLEIFLYNFFETIKDIQLFTMDLIND